MSPPATMTPRHEPRASMLPTFPEPGRILPGDRIEVQNRYNRRWASGFEVVDVLPGMGVRHYRIKRLSDGAILPRLFVEDEIDGQRDAGRP